ncbi:helix-turn-helix domain-containing protein [Pseudomonas nicosulfuronedens]|uniref:Helix-turn-helix domain-containing protein n=1 Tax=Pseudomonas nicosulfuronedens TaxID=2571105 RepID=A0A5R9QMV0_9PSED|nr:MULTISPECIES: helix-turn-helix domain-containing protein [Pseudomonas]TLX70639.1 helix-turn-helix domain-containing protein [Pseudomonas nicosulfuronedens]
MTPDIRIQLRERRRALKLSQRELAQRCNLHQPQIARLENGGEVQLSTLESAASALGLKLGLVPSAEALESPSEPEAHDLLASTEHSWQREWPSSRPNVFILAARILRAAQFIRQGLDEVAQRHDLHGGELVVLGALRRKGAPYESTPKQLRDEFWITLPGMTKRLERLESLGLVERRAASPGRGSIIRLSATGHALLDEHVAGDMSLEYQVINAQPEAMRSLLSHALGDLLEQMEQRRSWEATK